MNARTKSNMLLPVDTVNMDKASAPAETQDEELQNFMLLAGMSQLRIDQLFFMAEKLQAEGRAASAIELYQKWLVHTQDSQVDVVLFNYGSLLQSQGHTSQAEAAYRTCIERNPELLQASINLGLILERLGKSDEALETWSRVVAKGYLKKSADQSLQVMALNHIGRLYEQLKKYDLAEQALAQSLHLDPKQAGVIQHWVHIRQKACSWPVYKHLPTVTANEMLMHTSPLAMLSLHDDPVIQLLSAHVFVGRTYGFKEEWLCQTTYKHDKLRIGYLSGDLCTHAVGLLMADFLENHDHSKVELYAFDYSPEDGTDYRARLKKSFDHFHRVGHLKDVEVAALILEQEIDVLMDMHGLSSGARPGICAMHPAPLQGTYLGFIGTTAMPWLDFVVTDRQAMPESLTPYFTEKPLYLDGSFLPLNKSNQQIDAAPRESLGLPKDVCVMAAFGNVYKINEELLNSWVEILKRSTNTVLWLMDDNAYTTEQLKKKFRNYGVPEGRVVFSPRAHYGEYLSRLKTADLFLDSYPYNCGSTTHDVFNCGVPMVTLRGKTMVSRMGASMLDAIGMNELITDTFEAYIALTLKIANDPTYRTELAASLLNSVQRKQNNAHLLTASFERELDRMYQNKVSHRAD